MNNHRIFRSAFLIVCVVFLSASFAADSPTAEQLIDADDFGCIRDMTPVREFFVSNYKGSLEETLAVANSPTGGIYPAGSVIQLVPAEVMVKHDAGFSPATKDWEFIELNVAKDETTINKRGFTDVVNRFGGNCFACHIQAKPEWDLVCEKDHGCEPIALTATMIKAIQNTDPRCAPMELPQEQIDALQQLQALLAQPE